MRNVFSYINFSSLKRVNKSRDKIVCEQSFLLVSVNVVMLRWSVISSSQSIVNAIYYLRCFLALRRSLSFDFLS